jgi:hypothetical protein
VFRLTERYGEKCLLGMYRSIATLEHGVERNNDRMLHKLELEREHGG